MDAYVVFKSQISERVEQALMSDVSDVLDVYNATKTFVIAKKISCFKSKLCQNPCSNTQYSMFQVVRNCPQL